MATSEASRRPRFYQSIVFKNLVLFSCILLVAVVPLAWRYYQDSRDYELQMLAARLEFFAERGAPWIDVASIPTLTQPEHKQTPAYQTLLETLRRIENEFAVDNAVLMRRQADGHYTYIAIGHNEFELGQAVHIHPLFPATYKATNDTWLQGEMMHSQLFGGGEFDMFMQINTPLKLQDNVEAILMLNKFANPVAAAVRAKTLKVLGFSVGVVILGLGLFSVISAHMLRPLRTLTGVASAVAQGNLGLEVPPAQSRDEVGRLSMTFATMLEGLRQRDFIRDTFGRYISKEVVEELLGSPDGLKLGGELREVTFLVSDLRGFSSLAARLSPHDVLSIINRYLDPMVDIIVRYRGTIDEFQGDGILAFFGAPLAAADDPERAMACALEMQIALARINVEQRQLGLPELAMGVGVNTGEVIVGNIGSETRRKYGAIGSPINVAYRIESYTVGGEILVSPQVYARVCDLVQVRRTQQVHFKGLEHPVTLYDIVGMDGAYRLRLPDKDPESFCALEPPLAVACFALQGKAIADVAIAGHITHLAASAAAAKALLAGPVAVHDDLQILMTTTAASGVSALYAKVLALDPPDAPPEHTMVSLSFTSLANDTKTFLEQQRSAPLPEHPLPTV